ncbi:MAG: hypothetical protein MK102_03165, partial [Fuerstiella sp.]|nr:hypothetical protein [Fuerstiella sp.]
TESIDTESIDTESIDTESIDTESIDDLPTLDDLASGPSPDELIELDCASLLPDRQPTDSTVLNGACSFDAGYLLADHESVGEPAMDIDEDLDQRLLRGAETASDSNSASQQEASDFSDILANFSRWSPAGTWPPSWSDHEKPIRSWTQLESSDHNSLELQSVVDDKCEPSSHMEQYEINMPSRNVPLPLWPPQRPDIGPANPIPVNGLTDSTRTEASNFENTAVPAALADAGEIPESIKQQPDGTDRGQHWLGGQLNNSMANKTSSADEGKSDVAPKAVNTVTTPLRIVGSSADRQLETRTGNQFGIETIELIRPELMNQTPRMMSASLPAGQLRKAAGAENSVLREDKSPAFSVTGGDEQPQSEEDAPKVVDTRSCGFRTLFTRMREQQQ